MVGGKSGWGQREFGGALQNKGISTPSNINLWRRSEWRPILGLALAHPASLTRRCILHSPNSPSFIHLGQRLSGNRTEHTLGMRISPCGPGAHPRYLSSFSGASHFTVTAGHTLIDYL